MTITRFTLHTATTNALSVTIKLSAAKGLHKMFQPSGIRPKIGFFSGTFDPVHTGHIAFVTEAIKRYGLQKVILLPEEVPRAKTVTTPFKDRLEMVRMVTKNTPNISVALLPMPTFTVKDSLPLVQAMAPGAQLIYLCGSDVVKTFVYRWEGLSDLVSNCEIIVGLRNNETKKDVATIMQHVAPHSTWQAIHAPRHLLASTQIRQGTHTITDLDPQVADYIKSKDLYS